MTPPGRHAPTRWRCPRSASKRSRASSVRARVDPVWLHRVTGGNAFFVCEMLDITMATTDLPTTVRDAVLARTTGLDPAAWDLLNLLTCSPGAIPDHLLTALGVTLPASRALADAGLIRRSSRGVAFRHDLCRLAIRSVIPPGAEPRLHRRLIDAYEATSDVDPAVLTHHALGAGDVERIRRAPTTPVPRPHAPAHTPRPPSSSPIALDRGGPLDKANEAELLELLAWEFYLIDQPARCDHRLPPRDADPPRAGRVGGGEREPPLAGRLPVVQREPRTRRRPCRGGDVGARRRFRRCRTNSCNSVTRSPCRPTLRCRRAISTAPRR